MMLAAVVCVAAFSVVSAQDSVTTELSKILKRSRYFVAKLEMVADELQVSTEALKDGMQNLSSPLDDCRVVNSTTSQFPSSDIDFRAKAGKKAYLHTAVS